MPVRRWRHTTPPPDSLIHYTHSLSPVALEQRQVAKVGIRSAGVYACWPGDITAIHQHQRVGRTGPHAGRAPVIEVAEVAFHGNSAHARYPVEQRADARRRRRRGGASRVLAFAGISSGRLPENSMAPNGQAMPHSLQLTHRLVELDRAIDALDGVNRADGGAGSIFTVVAHLRCRFFHYASPVAAA